MWVVRAAKESGVREESEQHVVVASSGVNGE